MIRGTLIAIALGALVSAARAEPVAIVEDINGQRDDLQSMDFLDAGSSFELRAEETLQLGYLTSCIQETITGGRLTVGQTQSEVSGGKVTRKSLACDGGTSTQTANPKRDAGAVVFRAKKNAKSVKAEHEVFGLSPLIRLTEAASEIRIARADGRGKKYIITAQNNLADLASQGIKLKRNVTYRLDAGERSTTFRVSAKAKRKAALLSRMIRF